MGTILGRLFHSDVGVDWIGGAAGAVAAVVTDAVSRQAVPQGDWFCPDCRPKQRSSRLTSRQQHPVYEEEDEESFEEQEEMESAEEDEPEDVSDEEVVVRYDGKYFFIIYSCRDQIWNTCSPSSSRTRKKQAPPPKGKSRTAAKIRTPVAPKTATTSRKSPASRCVCVCLLG